MKQFKLCTLIISISFLHICYTVTEKISEYNESFNSTDYEKLIKKNQALHDYQTWEDKIQKFFPENLLTVKIAKKDLTIFYEDISKVPTTVTVAFYVHEEKEKIDFEVYEGEKKLLKKIKGKNREFYEFNVTKPASYSFHLNNERFKNNKKVTFAIHGGQNKESNLIKEDMQDLHLNITRLNIKTKELHFSQQLLNRRYESHFDGARLHNQRILTYSLLECFVMLLILILQFLYLKKLLNSF